MSRLFSLENLYQLNLSLLITHEIDSAFWKEWEFFGLPGGIQLFLLLNFALVILLLHGYERLVRKQSLWKMFSWLVIAAGFIAALLHGYFLAAGHPQFRLAASLITLVAILLTSVAQTTIMLKQE
jgi:hypothetical protein